VISGFRSFLYNEQNAARHLKTASVTMSCDRDPVVNRLKIVNTVDRIKSDQPDIELVIFGELILGWYNPCDMPEYHRDIAQRVTKETLQDLASLSLLHRIYLCFGMSEIDDGILYNAQVLLNPKGEIQAVHRKSNLKSSEITANFKSGSVPVTITDIKGLKTGIVICSDAANPRTMRELMRSHLDLIILSLADDHDEDFFMARCNARMYDAWIVTANRYGDENGRFWDGHMVISDPLGRLRAVGQKREQHLVHELKFADDKSWLKKLVRSTLIKIPLPIYILKNWKKVRSYY